MSIEIQSTHQGASPNIRNEKQLLGNVGDIVEMYVL